jgi:DNA-directed RNA polymerase specialized sigma24 family protein
MMISPYFSSQEKNQEETGKPELRNVSDSKLVQLCLENNRPAWEEFFRRFIPTIKSAIRKKLELSGRKHSCHDEDIIWNIHEKIVVKLYSKGILRQYTNPSGLRSWLKTMARNQTRDWIMEQGRKKRLPKVQSEDSTVSMFSPVRGRSVLTLEGILTKESESDNVLTDKLENILRKIHETNFLEDEKKLWILRLSIVDHLPLSQEDIEKLSEYSGISKTELIKRLDKIMSKVETKEEKRLEALGKAVLLWHEIRRLEHRVNESVKDPSKEKLEEIEKIKRKIEEKREALLKRGCRVSRPSNRDIAELVRLSENKVNQVSNLLIRIRNAL